MWEDIIKAFLNLSLGTASVMMQIFQHIQNIMALTVGVITIIYLYYQIKKIRLDIRTKQKQFSDDDK